MILDIAIFLCIGVLAGTLAGLLGLGGGIIVVPSLFFMFLWHNFPPETIAQSAISSSLAAMIFTSISSVITHYRFGYVNVSLFKALLPGLLLGIMTGVLVAVMIPTNVLKIMFSIFLFVIAFQMFFSKKRQKQTETSTHDSQKTVYKLKMPFFWSYLFGGLSSLLGVGAGSTFVPYMHFNHVQFNRAIGTASAITCVTAIWATVCYQIFGSLNLVPSQTSSSSLIYWPAVLSIAFTSIIFAYIGARLSHKLEATKLKKIFSLVLVVISITLLFAK